MDNVTFQQGSILPQTMYDSQCSHDHLTPVVYGPPQHLSYPYIHHMPFNNMTSFGNYGDTNYPGTSMFHESKSQDANTRNFIDTSCMYNNSRLGKCSSGNVEEDKTGHCFSTDNIKQSASEDHKEHKNNDNIYSDLLPTLSSRLCLPNIKASENFAENVMNEESDLGYSSFCDMSDFKLEDMVVDSVGGQPNLSNILDDVLDTLDEHMRTSYHSRPRSENEPNELYTSQKITSPTVSCTFPNVIFNFQNHQQDVLQLNRSCEQTDLFCSSCRKHFRTKSEMTTHMRSHKDARPHKCPHCEKRFNQKSTLRTHVRTHTGEKPFSCHYCSRAFGDYSTYRKHVRIHTGEKPYTCDVCKKSFTQSGNMIRHREIHNKK